MLCETNSYNVDLTLLYIGFNEVYRVLLGVANRGI